MTNGEPARTTTRGIGTVGGAGVLVAIAAMAAAVGYQLLASSSWAAAPSPPTAVSPIEILRGDDRGAPAVADAFVPDGSTVLPREQRGTVDESDGSVPDGATVFDDEYPGIANLDAHLLGALREAATDAAHDGIEFYVTSGWRSREYQHRLLLEAVSAYGSEEEAARWVGTAETSAHVSGDAVDIGSSDATAWLSEHGSEYELCQIYANEPWHYELRPEASDHGCPPVYADPTHDPRMRH
jgi:D-alanyl-D-alanine carboxypeptidase